MPTILLYPYTDPLWCSCGVGSLSRAQVSLNSIANGSSLFDMLHYNVPQNAVPFCLGAWHSAEFGHVGHVQA